MQSTNVQVIVLSFWKTSWSVDFSKTFIEIYCTMSTVTIMKIKPLRSFTQTHAGKIRKISAQKVWTQNIARFSYFQNVDFFSATSFLWAVGSARLCSFEGTGSALVWHICHRFGRAESKQLKRLKIFFKTENDHWNKLWAWLDCEKQLWVTTARYKCPKSLLAQLLLLWK